MNFMVSNATGLPPVWVQGSYTDSGVFGGVSTGSNHLEKRKACMTQFTEWFGRMPLVTTSVAVTSLSSWTPMHTPPAIWEWFHPI